MVCRVAVLSDGVARVVRFGGALPVPGFLGFRSFVDGLYLVLLVFGFGGWVWWLL